MAMNGENRFSDVGDIAIDSSNQIAKFAWRGVPNGVWNVDRGGASGNRRLDHLVEELRVAAAGVFTGKFNVVHQGAGIADHLGNDAEHVGTALAQFVLEVNVAGGDESVDSATRCR